MFDELSLSLPRRLIDLSICPSCAPLAWSEVSSMVALIELIILIAFVSLCVCVVCLGLSLEPVPLSICCGNIVVVLCALEVYHHHQGLLIYVLLVCVLLQVESCS